MEGEDVAWFQGAIALGPRAPGNRSILANPVDGAVDPLNAHLKPAHLDGSARPQIVDQASEPRDHRLSVLREKTGRASPEDTLTLFFGCGLEHRSWDFHVSKRTMDPS